MKRVWLLLGLLLMTAVSPHPALAHAELLSATPTPGSSLETLTEIRLTFTEPIAANGQIELLQDFVSAAKLQPMIDPGDPTILVTAVPTLPDGVYTVQWSVSSADGHPISGSYSLGLNSTPPQPETPWYLSSWTLAGLLVGSFGAAALILRRWRPLTARRAGKNG